MKKILFAFLLLPAVKAPAQFFNWAKEDESLYFSTVNDVTTDPAGNVISVGYFVEQVDLDPGPAVVNFYENIPGATDLFIQKLDAGGNYLWGISLGDIGFDYARKVTTDALGNIYVMGQFDKSFDADPGPGVVTLTNISNSNTFVLKLTPSGNLRWAKCLRSALDEYATFISCYANTAISIGGFMSDTVDFDPGPGIVSLGSAGGQDCFVMQLDSAGNYAWAKVFGSTWTTDQLFSGATDPLGNIVVTGVFNSTIDLDPGPGTAQFTDTLGAFYLLKLDGSGNFISAGQYGNPSGVSNIPFALHCDAFGNISIAGYTPSITAFDFDPGPGITIDNSGPTASVFVLKTDNTGSLLWFQPYHCTTSSFGPLALQFYSTGAIVVAATYAGNIDFDPGPGVMMLNSTPGAEDFFVLHLSGTSGTVTSLKSIGSSNVRQEVYSCKTDNSSNLYLGGYTENSTDLDPGSGIYTINTMGRNQGFTAKWGAEPTGLTETGAAAEPGIFPNPVHDLLFINGDCTAYILYDIAGKIIGRGNDSHEVPFSNYAPGIYFIRLNTGETWLTRRVVKQ